jgi:uncharacterized LabA/DUF88 family protein
MDYNLYLDNSNVFIEGQRVYAARQDPGRRLSVKLDKQYRLDFGKLIEITCGYDSDLGKLMFYGSEPPPTDSVWAAAEQHGFQNKIFQRSKHNKEKMVDTQMTVDLIRDIYTDLNPATDRIVVVAGDADYVPAIRAARDRGFYVKVAFWQHASAAIKNAASEFQPLNGHLRDLTHKRHGGR